jgi:hypothetical protein
MWRNLAVTQLWATMYPDRLRAVHYPWWDDWDLPPNSIQMQRGFQPIAVIAFCLDDPVTTTRTNPETGEEETVSERETVIDLVHGLPGIKLNDDLIQEIRSRHGRDLLLPNKYLNIAVFAEDYQLGTPTQIEDNVKPVIEIKGDKLIVRAQRPYTQYRLVISLNPKPINLTAKPLQCEVYPSRWYDLTAPSYINTKDSIVNTDKTYYYFDPIASDYVQIPTTEGEPISDVYARIAKVEEVYEKDGDEYVVTKDNRILKDKAYYTYSVGTDAYSQVAFPVDLLVSDIKSHLAEAGCVYEYKDAVFGEDIIGTEEPIVGYTVCTDKTVKYDIKYYTKNADGEMEELTGLEFGDELPTDTTVYIKEADDKKYYINKAEVNMSLGNRMHLLALSMTAGDDSLPVYEEVEIPAGTPLEEVLETLQVKHLYTDNPDKPLEEPIVTPTTKNDHYINSYKGYNACRVFQVTFCIHKKQG